MALRGGTTWISFQLNWWKCFDSAAMLSQLWEGRKKKKNRSTLLKDQIFSLQLLHFLHLNWTVCFMYKLQSTKFPSIPFYSICTFISQIFFHISQRFHFFSVLISGYEIISLISVIFQTLQASLDTLDLWSHSHVSSLRSFNSKNTFFTSLKFSYGKVHLSNLVTIKSICRNRHIQRVMCLLLRPVALLLSINF